MYTESELQEQYDRLVALISATSKQIDHFKRVHQRYMKDNACLDEVDNWATAEVHLHDMVRETLLSKLD